LAEPSASGFLVAQALIMVCQSFQLPAEECNFFFGRSIPTRKSVLGLEFLQSVFCFLVSIKDCRSNEDLRGHHLQCAILVAGIYTRGFMTLVYYHASATQALA
jgi:hypothetical protein